MNGMADDIDEFMNEIPDMGQDFDAADRLINLIRDNEQGMRDDDEQDIEQDVEQDIMIHDMINESINIINVNLKKKGINTELDYDDSNMKCNIELAAVILVIALILYILIRYLMD